jgi:acyl carrier protein
LPALEAAAAQTQVYEAPQTAVEESLAAIWAELLRRERIGRNENFFDIGGHSLLATQVVSRLRRTFEVDLPLRTLFETPTVAGLARAIEAAQNEPGVSAVPGIVPVSRDRDLPLSYAQQRLWVLDQIEPNNPMYNIARGWRLKGVLNGEALRLSLNEIVRRHESQRTTFRTRSSEPVQVIAPQLEIDLPVVDLSFLPPDEREPEAYRLAAQSSSEAFDLAKGPLLRARLFKLGAQDHVLLLSMHHIVSDAWSAGVFFQELTALYDAFSSGRPSGLPELPIQYADYAVWQRNWLAGEVLTQQLGYWEEQLRGAPAVMALPFDRPRPAVQSFVGAHETVHLPAALSTALNQCSRAAGATLFMTLLAGFGALLNRLSGVEQLVIGTDAANRPTAETEQLIGFFINLLPLRIHLSGNPTFEVLLRRVKDVTLGAYAHQDVPFDKVVEHLRPERVSSHNPVVQVLFVMQNVPRSPRQLPGLDVSAFEIPITHSKFDLAVFVAETPGGLVAHWLYKTGLFDRQTILRMADGFEAVLQAAASQTGRRLGSFALVKNEDKAERETERRKRREGQFSKLKSLTLDAVALPQVTGNESAEE